MIYFIIKHWKLFLDILLVVGTIVVFTLFDPLRMFARLETRATANMVTGVREIGQLTTVEYYGEVISSWKEFKITQFPKDSLSTDAEDLFVQLKYVLSQYDKDLTEKVKADPIIKEYNNIVYEQFLAFIGHEMLGMRLKSIFDEKENDGNGKLKSRAEDKILRRLKREGSRYKDFLEKKYKKEDKDIRKELVDGDWEVYLDSIPPVIDRFHEFHLNLTRRILSKGKNKRKDIVFIGRGWVKAGYDFGKFDESNFMFDDDAKMVHFYGLTPVILDADINPWFIPEKKVKGFELVDYSGNVTFEEAIEVKKQCKAKLMEMARRADIIEKAAENGQEALKNFFSILLDEPELAVKFHANPFDVYYQVIASDTLIDIYEARLIDSLYTRKRIQIKQLDSLGSSSESVAESDIVEKFIGKLKELPFVEKGYSFSYYSLEAAKMLNDTFYLNDNDFQRLVELRDTLQADPEDTTKLITPIILEHRPWFAINDFRQEFNSTLKLLETLRYCPVKTDSLSRFTKTDRGLKYDSIFVIPQDTFETDSDNKSKIQWLNFKYVTCTAETPFSLSVLKYDPVTSIQDVASFQLEFSNKYDSIRLYEGKLTAQKLAEDSIYQSQTRIIRNLSAKLNTLIENIKKN